MSASTHPKASRPRREMTPAQKERAKERTKAWRAANPERVAAMYRRKYERQRDVAWARNLRLKYGLSVEQYEEMYQQQDGLCAICRNPETQMRNGRLKRLAVDHCHRTGVVRALLCGNCNNLLGRVKDDVWHLVDACIYLREHGVEG